MVAYEDYIKRLHEEADAIYEVAEEARSKGHDPISQPPTKHYDKGGNRITCFRHVLYLSSPLSNNYEALNRG